MRSIHFLCGVLFVLFSITCFATTIDFEGLPSFAPIPNGYMGLDWDNFSTIDGSFDPFTNSGYANGAVSGPRVAYNIAGSTASIASGTPFDLVSGYFAAAWNDGLVLTILAYRSGSLVGSDSFAVYTSGATFRTFHFHGIDTVTFSSAGGTLNPNVTGSGMQFTMDSLTILLPSQTVPEPGSTALLGGGLALLAFLATRLRAHL